MTEIVLAKRFGALRPVDPIGEDFLRQIEDGQAVKAKITRPKHPRSVQNHRLYWSLVTLLHEHQTENVYPTPEKLSDAIKCAVGHYETIYAANGVEYRKPKSISFIAMDQKDFNDFFKRVVDLAVTRIIPGLDRDDLIREINDMLRVNA